MRDPYRRIATFYDIFPGPFLVPIRRAVLRVCRNLGAHRVLDLCCGTGTQVSLLHRNGFQVMGVDLSPAMLAVARENAPKDVLFFLEDASDLHFPAASFDLVVLSLALHEKRGETQSRILKEARRIIKDHGAIVIVDYGGAADRRARPARFMIHLVERAAGEEHYRCFREYLVSGGPAGLLERNGLKPEFRRDLYSGMIQLICTR